MVRPVGGRVLYFVQAASGPVKVGFTDNWPRRFRALQHGTHEELTAILVIAGNKDDESSAHAQLAPFRIRGEWFSASPEVLSYIESRRTEQLDVAMPKTLPARAAARETYVAYDRRRAIANARAREEEKRRRQEAVERVIRILASHRNGLFARELKDAMGMARDWSGESEWAPIRVLLNADPRIVRIGAQQATRYALAASAEASTHP